MGIIRVSNKINTYNVDEANLPKAEADGYAPVVSVSNGQQTHDVHPEDLHLALADGYKPISQIPSTTQDAIAGVGNGLALGGGSVVGGLRENVQDLVQSGLHNIGLANPSVTQANAALKEQGVQGDIGPTTEAELYKQARGETKKSLDEAQNRSPWAYGGGNLLGGLATTSALGAVGAMPELLAAQKGAPGLRAILAKEGLGTAATEALKRGTIATINAAPIGGVYGALSSDATLDKNPGQLGKDAIRGMATAGGIGLGLNLATEVGAPLVGAGMQKIGDKVFDKEALQKFASKRGAAAYGIKATTNNTHDIGSTLGKYDALPMTGGSQAMADAIEAAKTKIGNEQINPILTQIQNGLGDEGTQINKLVDNVGDIFNSFKEEVATRPDAIQIVKKVEGELEPYLDYVESDGTNLLKLNQIKQGLQEQETASYQMMPNGKRIPTPESRLYMELASAVRQHLEDLGNKVSPNLGDQLASANKDYGNLLEAGKSTANLINKDANKSILDFPTSVSTAAMSALFGVKTGGVSLLGKVALEKGTGHPIGRLANIASSKTATWLANSKQPNVVLDATKSLYNATPEALHGFSQTLMSTPGSQTTGQALMNALKNNDTTAKNAVLFSIMQQPKLRQLIHGESADKTSEKK